MEGISEKRGTPKNGGGYLPYTRYRDWYTGIVTAAYSRNNRSYVTHTDFTSHDDKATF